jgi:hypothetical protein
VKLKQPYRRVMLFSSSDSLFEIKRKIRNSYSLQQGAKESISHAKQRNTTIQLMYQVRRGSVACADPKGAFSLDAPDEVVHLLALSLEDALLPNRPHN